MRAVFRQAGAHPAQKTSVQLDEGRQLGVAVGDHHLGRLRRGRRPRIGGQIGQGHVDLVPHRAHDRHAAAGNAPDHRFVVEHHQVFGRTTAATHDDHLEIAHAFEPVEGLDDLRRRSLPLHRGGRQDDANAAAPERYLGDVVDRRARKRSSPPR